ncbi:MAG: glycosyltransferase [Candidatus Helarchaeota archaeon]
MKISVVIPTYNEERGIDIFLRQFENQTMPRSEFEIIVVDGNSKDATREIAKKYADIVLIQKSNGIGGARNDGVELAKAEIIATTDADVILAPFWLERIHDRFEKDKDLALLFGPHYFITKNKLIRFLSTLRHMINQILATCHITYHAGGPNTAFRKRKFIEAGGYSDIPFLDDIEITSRMRKLGKIVYDNRLYIYASTRRFEKWGINKSLFFLLSTYLKFILFGKKSLQTKSYARQQY